MLTIAFKLSPILLLFSAGILLRHYQILKTTHADGFLRIVVNIGMPALILATISRVELKSELTLLPVCAVLTVCTIWPVSSGVGKMLRLPRASLGVFVVGPMIMNLAFVYPFILAAWNEAAFAQFLLVDFGHSMLVLTLVYALACRYGSGQSNIRATLTGVASFPPFLALMIALVFNLTGITMPEIVLDTLKLVGRLLILLIMLALGIYFDIHKLRLLPLTLAIVIRVVFGLLLGLLWVEWFGLEGISRAMVLMATAAPIGFNTLVYASMQNLDKELAASMVSVSVLLAMIYLPILIFLLI